MLRSALHARRGGGESLQLGLGLGVGDFICGSEVGHEPHWLLHCLGLVEALPGVLRRRGCEPQTVHAGVHLEPDAQFLLEA